MLVYIVTVRKSKFDEIFDRPCRQTEKQHLPLQCAGAQSRFQKLSVFAGPKPSFLPLPVYKSTYVGV